MPTKIFISIFTCIYAQRSWPQFVRTHSECAPLWKYIHASTRCHCTIAHMLWKTRYDSVVCSTSTKTKWEREKKSETCYEHFLRISGQRVSPNASNDVRTIITMTCSISATQSNDYYCVEQDVEANLNGDHCSLPWLHSPIMRVYCVVHFITRSTKCIKMLTRKSVQSVVSFRRQFLFFISEHSERLASFDFSPSTWQTANYMDVMNYN